MQDCKDARGLKFMKFYFVTGGQEIQIELDFVNIDF